MTTPETLTEEERAHIRNALATAGDPLTPFGDAVAKILRIHDAQAARVKELERGWAAQIRDLAPRIGLRALEGVPEEVKALLSGPPDCPACGPDPCTPSCPEREWRYGRPPG
jgi:hypothetical protein